MEAFYALARLDYELLAGALDWGRLLGELHGERGRLELLDVACGSGKFPEALERHADLSALDGASVTYDLLDPSAFSLREAAAALRPPFVAGDRYESTVEDLGPAGPWDVVWATHALYALDPAKLDAAVARYLAARAPHGVSFLAQGSRDGHYLRVYDAFLTGVRGGEGTPYVASEDLIDAMRGQGAEPQVRRLRYDHVVAAGDTAVLQGYLQRCLFDDTLALAELLEAPVLGPYLVAAHDAVAGVYRFHQEVDLVVLTRPGGTPPWTVAS